MSSSYPDSTNLRCAILQACALLGMAAGSAGTALAADTYMQPQAELSVESNSNLDLVPGGGSGSSVYGYIADLQALIGIATLRSDTSMRPRIRIQEYPDRDNIEGVEAFFDLRSQYRWERSRLLTIARFSRQDSYNAELQPGEFDPLDPNDPGDTDLDTVVVGETRNRYLIEPEFTFDLTERTQAGVAASYRVVRYDSEGLQTRIDYDYSEGSAFVSWAFDPRSAFTVGAYANRYEARDDSTETDGFGGELGYQYRWSEAAGVGVEILYEQNDKTDFVPVTFEERTSGWGGIVTAHREAEVSAWSLSVGRTFIPTGDGGKAESDQLRLQYSRDLTTRLEFTGAGRYESRRALSTGGQTSDRDYARADVTLRWMMAATWYLQGGYSYIWEDRENATGTADNNRFFVSFGYKGLDRPRR